MADIGTLSSIGIPAGVLIILGYMQHQIKGKQSKEICKEIHQIHKSDIAKGDKKFEKINDTLVLHTETLGRIDEKLKFIAEKNGYKEK